jgi:hypothetical protein
MKWNNFCVGTFMKFEGCERRNGIILYAGKFSRFVMYVGFPCVPFIYIYIFLYFDFSAVKLL